MTKDRLRACQRRLYEAMDIALAKEIADLRDSFGTARDLACSEWSEGIIPSSTGGYKGLRPTKMKPEMMDLLNKNFNHQLQDIMDRKEALQKLFEKGMI